MTDRPLTPTMRAALAEANTVTTTGGTDHVR
jgi:hypothetical protein